MASIQIQWLGHSCFRVECQGYAVVLDPFEPGSVPGLREAHLGDIGAMPAPDVVERLQNLDAVLVPVGGFYTVGPKEAKEIVDALQARVVIPMHYRSDAFGFDVLAPVEDFLELDSHWMRYETDTLEIHENMRHSVAVLSYGG